MPIFAVTRYLPGLTTAQLDAVRSALVEAARRVEAGGVTVRYIRSTYVSASSECLCVFRAETADAVTRANEIAQVPFRRVDEAIEVDMAAGGAR
jgi:hypothetical protein